MTMSKGQRWVLVLTSVASLMIMLDALVVTTALHAIARDLHASIADLEWIVNAYALPFAVLLMAGAALGEQYGRRRILVGGLVTFVVASAGCALAPGLGWLVAARAMQGVGAAAVAPVALSILSAAFGAAERPRALGLFASITGLATAAGPVVGGAIVQNLTWQWIFWINVPIAAVLIPLILVRLERNEGLPRRIDIVGIGLASAASFGFIWGLIRGNESGWGSAEVLGTFAGGLVALAVFVGWELRTDSPLMPMHFFARRAFSVGNTAGFLLFASIYSGAFFFAQFLQVVLRHGPMATGLLLLPWTVVLFVIAPFAGKQVGKLGARPLVVTGLLLQAVGFSWIAMIARPGLPYVALILPFVISGAGLSMAIPSAQSAVIAAVPVASIGAASGTFSTVRQLGGAFGIAITTAVFAARGGLDSAITFSNGFAAAIGTAAGLAFVGALLGLLLSRPNATEPRNAVVHHDRIREPDVT
ncbi:MFS transporter [Flindersiella endophytica]